MKNFILEAMKDCTKELVVIFILYLFKMLKMYLQKRKKLKKC